MSSNLQSKCHKPHNRQTGGLPRFQCTSIARALAQQLGATGAGELEANDSRVLTTCVEIGEMDVTGRPPTYRLCRAHRERSGEERSICQRGQVYAHYLRYFTSRKFPKVGRNLPNRICFPRCVLDSRQQTPDLTRRDRNGTGRQAGLLHVFYNCDFVT